jgi:hypothetical protein
MNSSRSALKFLLRSHVGHRVYGCERHRPNVTVVSHTHCALKIADGVLDAAIHRSVEHVVGERV